MQFFVLDIDLNGAPGRPQVPAGLARGLKWFMVLASGRLPVHWEVSSLCLEVSRVAVRRRDPCHGVSPPGVCSMAVPKCVVVMVMCACPVVCGARGVNAVCTVHTVSVWSPLSNELL